MPKILSSIACNLDNHILQTALPLFAAEKVEAIEWAFDTLFSHRNIPDWFVELLEAFGKEGRLVGHGVFFSLFSGKWKPEQTEWLSRLERMSRHFQFDHVTEHFGFMTGQDFHKGAPISIPFTTETLAIGQDRLKRIYNAAQCPVGLENLAFAYSMEEVKKHGDFLNALIEPINGFIILDLHNLYCQMHNFEVSFEEIINLYPLEKVREIHISGGSWEDSDLVPTKKIRRDTHDDSVPNEVFNILEKSLDKCPNLKFVVLEQLGLGLKTDESKIQFRNDFYRMDQIVQKFNQNLPEIPQNNFLPNHDFTLNEPLESTQLHAQQLELSNILENASNLTDAQNQLNNSNLSNSSWQVEKWEPHMIETVMKIAQKWKNGFG